MTIYGMTRCRNEGRWLRNVLSSYLPLCERIYLLDDHSNDSSDEIAEKLDERITVIRSPFEDVTNETRDKNLLISRVMANVSDINLRGNEKSPCWAIHFDSDEQLETSGIEVIRNALQETKSHAFKLPIKYLWDADLSLVTLPGKRRIRVDGVYRNFARPSIFRLFNSAFTFQETPWGGNFHCSSIPQQLLHHAAETLNAPLLHYGYNHKADRLRKYEWYNRVDPNNAAENFYKHVVQGDIPEVPIDAKLMHAGPMMFEMM